MSRVGHDRPLGRLALDIGCFTGYPPRFRERHGGDHAAGPAGTVAVTVTVAVPGPAPVSVPDPAPESDPVPVT